MNQTRVLLMIAWLFVAVMLWMEWGKFNAPKVEATAAPAAAIRAANTADTVPTAAPVTAAPAAANGTVPDAAPLAGATSAPAPAVSAAPRVVVSTDVLRLVLDGGSVLQADLLQYPQEKKPGSAPVRLYDADAAKFYAAQSGWTSAANAAPTHLSGFVPEQAGAELALAPGQEEIVAPFVWHGPDGVSIRRTYTLKRGDYAVQVRDEVSNVGSATWQGNVYRQLLRVPLQLSSSITKPQSFSFNGATWYDGEYQRRPFKDYLDDGPVDKSTSQGWIALLQHHFFSAWIPQASDKIVISLAAPNHGAQALIRETGPAVSVAPGQRATTSARLYIGPKLIAQMKAQQVPGLERAVDYSRFAPLALIGEGLFWILNHLHALLKNWGWSIIGLVVIVKLVLYPLTNKQYESAVKMRKFQPRMAQLKERYGDDRQKLQLAMMDLYKKEGVNPMSGCLPVLVTMPIFLSLYYVLVESVELRQAPWFGWVQDLTAQDPYFILPVINVAIMWYTQKMTPTAGMDPTQAKMMQFMPLVFGVMMAFMPSGLVLYWVTNGALGLLQQWWVYRRHGQPVPAAAK